jgi:hypothetical protein
MHNQVTLTRAVLHGARDLRLEQETYSLDSLGERQIFVETEVSALSTGTDLGNYEGRSREVPPPRLSPLGRLLEHRRHPPLRRPRHPAGGKASGSSPRSPTSPPTSPTRTS